MKCACRAGKHWEGEAPAEPDDSVQSSVFSHRKVHPPKRRNTNTLPKAENPDAENPLFRGCRGSAWTTLCQHLRSCNRQLRTGFRVDPVFWGLGPGRNDTGDKSRMGVWDGLPLVEKRSVFGVVGCV